MTGLIAAIFLASVLGSLHCAGMCGAFVVFAVTGGATTPGAKARLHAAYHLGRLTVYTSLGAAAGSLGLALDLAGSLVGLQRLAAVSAGAMMVGVGMLTILRLRGVRLGTPPLPPVFERWLSAGYAAASAQTPILRAALTGLLTTLLPCGWLYAFVITAAGTGSAAHGALAMAFFWLGTLPMLVAVGAVAQKLTGALGRYVPLVTAFAVVAVGCLTVIDRASLFPSTLNMLDPGTPLTARAALDRARSFSSDPAAVCHDRY